MEPGRIPIRTIALSQALQLGDDLTVESGCSKPSMTSWAGPMATVASSIA